MSAMTHNIDLVLRQDNINSYTHYSYHYDSVIFPRIQRPPISFS